MRPYQDHFTYRVSWSAEDGEHVATRAEFPSLSHLAKDPEDALRGLRALVADVVSDLRTAGESVPVPLTEQMYSGKFMTRVPSELHRRLAIEAAEEGVSLNRLVSFRLAVPFSLSSQSGASGSRAAARTGPGPARKRP